MFENRCPSLWRFFYWWDHRAWIENIKKQELTNLNFRVFFLQSPAQRRLKLLCLGNCFLAVRLYCLSPFRSHRTDPSRERHRHFNPRPGQVQGCPILSCFPTTHTFSRNQHLSYSNYGKSTTNFRENYFSVFL